MGFFIQSFLVVGGEGPFAGEEAGTVVGGEVVVEFRGQTEVDGRGGGQGTDMDGEEGGVFGLPFDLDQTTVSQLFEHPFEGGERDMGETGEVVVANRTAGFVVGMGQPPQPEIHRLFRGREVGQDLVDDVLYSL